MNLGKGFHSPEWAENSTASRALLAHEVAHVWQDEQRRARRHDPTGLLFFLVALAIFFTLPNAWCRLAGGTWLCGVAAISGTPHFITFDQVISVALLAFLIPAVATSMLSVFLFLRSRHKDQTYRDLGLSAGRFALVVAIVGVGWLGARSWGGASQVPLEFEADQISACLTSPARVVEMGMNFSRTNIDSISLPPVYHPSHAARISAMSSFDQKTCPWHPLQ